jgi:hypothetical protein
MDTGGVSDGGMGIDCEVGMESVYTMKNALLLDLDDALIDTLARAPTGLSRTTTEPMGPDFQAGFIR